MSAIPTTAAAPLPRERTDHRRIVAWGSRAGIAAPIAALFAFVVGAPVYADDLSEAAGTGRFVVAAATALVVLVLLALALVGFYARAERQLGTAGHVGFLIALVGTMLAAGGAWDSLFTLPYLADQAPAVLDKDTGGSLLAGFVISYLVMVVGWVTFTTSVLRARIAPRAAAITMLVGSIIAILPAPTPLRLLVLSVGAALVGRATLRAER